MLHLFKKYCYAKKVLIILVLFSIKAYAFTLKPTPTVQQQIQQLLVAPQNRLSSKYDTESRAVAATTLELYRRQNFMPIWYQNNDFLPQVQITLEILKNSWQDGLNSGKYHLSELEESYTHRATMNSIAIAQFDIELTNALVSYLNDLAYGTINYKKYYPYWSYNRRQIDVAIVFLQYIHDHNPSNMLNAVLPKIPLYTHLRDYLLKYYRIKIHGGFPLLISHGSELKVGSRGKKVLILQQRLLLSGELAPNQIKQPGVYDKFLKQAIRRYQRNNGLKVTGRVDSNTLNNLNISVNKKIAIIAKNMNRIRMMQLVTESNLVLVNIPDYKLTIVNNNQEVAAMKVIVGNQRHPSCVLNSKIIYLEINPYWNIPKSIAIKDLLPKVINNPDYLQQKNIDTYIIESEERYLIDPKSVNWTNIDPKHFGYFFRQNPGPENALGRIKFVFSNKCSIYLHDTNEPFLFTRNARDLSHGCIRVAQPLMLATYLLKDKPYWKKDVIESTIATGKRQVVMLSNHKNIAIIYLTAFVNESGELQFRPDIYNIDNNRSAVQHTQ